MFIARSVGNRCKLNLSRIAKNYTVVHKNIFLNFSLFLSKICINVEQNCSNYFPDCVFLKIAQVVENAIIIL